MVKRYIVWIGALLYDTCGLNVLYVIWMNFFMILLKKKSTFPEQTVKLLIHNSKYQITVEEN